MKANGHKLDHDLIPELSGAGVKTAIIKCPTLILGILKTLMEGEGIQPRSITHVQKFLLYRLVWVRLSYLTVSTSIRRRHQS